MSPHQGYAPEAQKYEHPKSRGVSLHPLIKGLVWFYCDLRQYSCDTPYSAIGTRRQLELRYLQEVRGTSGEVWETFGEPLELLLSSTARELSWKSPGNFRDVWETFGDSTGKSGDFPEAQGSLTPSQPERTECHDFFAIAIAIL